MNWTDVLEKLCNEYNRLVKLQDEYFAKDDFYNLDKLDGVLDALSERIKHVRFEWLRATAKCEVFNCFG